MNDHDVFLTYMICICSHLLNLFQYSYGYTCLQYFYVSRRNFTADMSESWLDVKVNSPTQFLQLFCPTMKADETEMHVVVCSPWCGLIGAGQTAAVTW